MEEPSWVVDAVGCMDYLSINLDTAISYVSESRCCNNVVTLIPPLEVVYRKMCHILHHNTNWTTLLDSRLSDLGCAIDCELEDAADLLSCFSCVIDYGALYRPA